MDWGASSSDQLAAACSKLVPDTSSWSAQLRWLANFWFSKNSANKWKHHKKHKKMSLYFETLLICVTLSVWLVYTHRYIYIYLYVNKCVVFPSYLHLLSDWKSWLEVLPAAHRSGPSMAVPFDLRKRFFDLRKRRELMLEKKRKSQKGILANIYIQMNAAKDCHWASVALQPSSRTSNHALWDQVGPTGRPKAAQLILCHKFWMRHPTSNLRQSCSVSTGDMLAEADLGSTSGKIGFSPSWNM